MQWCTSSLISDDWRTSGAVQYTQMLNQRGGIESDMTFMAQPGSVDGFYVVTGAGSATRDMDHVAETAFNKGIKNVKIREVTDDIAVLAVAGPGSRSVLEEMVLGGQPLDSGSFPFSTWQSIQLQGPGMEESVQVKAVRISYVGELGWELHVPCPNPIT
eukprot:TRINITY_DN9844_c0_g1_i16.p2 TRINITY_DN9844_c0_g1~~TRINITY_DN9844_c0_g1_i16.p2  ORF type:complete len:159 (+),score=36.06 TRINITY_DN9844_c0_g1_i16:544-1020(+)